MAEKAQAVLRKIKASRPFRNPKATERVLDEFNRSTLDDVGPLGGDQAMNVLKEMNDLEAGHDEFVQSLSY
jgi:hypothetical protein